MARNDLKALDRLINQQNAESINKEVVRQLAVDYNSGKNKRTYRIDPTYASILGPSFTVFWNMSPLTVFCDGIERPITNEHYQALQTYLQHQREQIRARSTKVTFDKQEVVGDFRRIR